MRSVRCFSFGIVASLLVTACGPATVTRETGIETKGVNGQDKEIIKSQTPPDDRETTPTKPSIGQPPPPAQPLALSRAVISRVQLQLKAQGFDPGPADGLMGPKTRAALRRFQSARGLPATGDPDTGTIEALGVK
jgi:peptidoglycan hydrolase-like protein with peptidoglycan-binding domain